MVSDRPSFVTRAMRVIAVIVATAALSACAAAPFRTPVPAERNFKARVPDFETVRFYGDKAAPARAFDFPAWRRNRIPAIRAATEPGEAPRLSVLALSGGGADGAFGAGLLNGWSQIDGGPNRRPEFEIVTGVSVGALMAPMAFLGPEYDDQLRDIFLARQGTDDIFVLRVLAALGGALAVGDSDPLRELIADYVDEDLLAAIAEQHAAGRRLFVGTTNLDSRRPIVWNMGEIASSSSPQKVRLFRDILLASASIPGVAPPVFIDVTLDGQTYQEMHVDGGVVNSVFVAAPSLTMEGRDALFGGITPRLYIIQNNKLRAPYGPTEDSLPGILADTISELIRAQSRGDHERLFFLTRERDAEYRLAAVPRDFDAPGGESFEPEYLRALYRVGFDLARRGYPWRTAPPSLQRAEIIEPSERLNPAASDEGDAARLAATSG